MVSAPTSDVSREGVLKLNIGNNLKNVRAETGLVQ